MVTKKRHDRSIKKITMIITKIRRWVRNPSEMTQKRGLRRSRRRKGNRKVMVEREMSEKEAGIGRTKSRKR